MQPEIEENYIDWKGWNSSAFGVYSNEECIQFAAEVRRAGVALSSDTRVLEIGFGNGSFAGWARQFTDHYVGIESNQVLVDCANAAGIEAYPSSTGLAAIAGRNTFDLIVAFDVIEHMTLEDIIATLRIWKENLATSGRILIRIPSGDSPFSGRIMHGDITHKTLLATTALKQIASLTNLNLIATYSPAMPIFGLGLKKAIERTVVLAVRKLATFLINATFHGNRHGVVTSNLIAIFNAKDTSN